MCSVTRPDGEVWRYGYDALGRRVRKVHLDEEVRFVWNGSVPIHELSVHDQTWTSWIFGQESFIPLAQAKNGDTYSLFIVSALRKRWRTVFRAVVLAVP